MKHLGEDITKRAEMTATASPNFPKVVALNRGESLTDLTRLDVDRKRLAQMELLQKQNEKKAEAALQRRIATFHRQQRAAQCLIEQEEKRLHEIESLPSFEDRFESAGNDDVFDCEDSEVDGERAAVIGLGRVSPIGGRSDSDSSSCKGSLPARNTNGIVKGKCSNTKPAHTKQNKAMPKDQRTMRNETESALNKQRSSRQEQRTSKQVPKHEQRTPKQIAPKHEQRTSKQAPKHEQRTPKQAPKHDQRTLGRSAEKTPGRSKSANAVQKSKSVSPAPKMRSASRSPSPAKPTGGVFSRLFPQHAAKFDFLRSKRLQPGEDYDASRERIKDDPPELIRRDISRSESLPPIKLEGKRMSRETSPRKRSNTGEFEVSAKARIPKADLVRRPVSKSPQPIPPGTAKYPRAKLEHRPRSESPRGPPKCKPERPSHSVPAKANPDSAIVKPRGPTPETTPKLRSKSPSKPSNFEIDRGKGRPKGKREKSGPMLSTGPAKKSKDSPVRAKSAPSSPSVRRKWERPSKVPDLAKVDILFFARKTENAEAFFVGLNPDESALPAGGLTPRPRSKTLPIKSADSSEPEDQKPRQRTNTDPLGSDEAAMVVNPNERLPAVGCSKSMEDMMNAKSSSTSHSPESSDVFDVDSLESSVGSDIDLDSLDEEPVTIRPDVTQSAILVYPFPHPSKQSVSPSLDPSSCRKPVEGTFDLTPTYVQFTPKEIQSPKPVEDNVTNEPQPDASPEQLNPKDLEVSCKSSPTEPNESLPTDDTDSRTDSDLQTKVVEENLPEVAQSSDSNITADVPKTNDQVREQMMTEIKEIKSRPEEELNQKSSVPIPREEEAVQVINDTFLEKSPLKLESVQVVMDATLEVHKEKVHMDDPEIPDVFPARDGPDQSIIDCYLEHHPVAPSEASEVAPSPATTLAPSETSEVAPSPAPTPTPTPRSTVTKPVQDLELDKDPVIIPEPNPTKREETQSVQQSEESKVMLSATIESYDSYTITEVREIKSRPSDREDTLGENIKMQLTAHIESVDEWMITEVKEIKSRPEEKEVSPKSSVAILKQEEEGEEEVEEVSDLVAPLHVNEDTTDAKETSVSVDNDPEPELSNKDQCSADDGTFSQSSLDDIQECQPFENQIPSETLEVDDKADLTKPNDDGVLIRRNLKPVSDANRESGVVLTSSGEEWSDSDNSESSGDSSGEYTVNRVNGLPEPLEVLEEETLLPGDFSDENSDMTSDQRKPSEGKFAEPSVEKPGSLGAELRQNMIPDGSDIGVMISEPGPSMQVCVVNIPESNNKFSEDIEDDDDDKQNAIIMDDLRQLYKNLEDSYAHSPERIVKDAPIDIISPTNDELQDDQGSPSPETDKREVLEDRLSPPCQLHMTSSEESLVYHSAEEDVTLYQTALEGDKAWTPTPLKNFISDIQAQSTPIRSPDKSKPEIIDEMVDYLPRYSQEIPDEVENKDLSKMNSTIETPIESNAVVVAAPDFKDMIDSISETHDIDDIEKAINLEDKPAKFGPEQMDEAAKIASELHQLQEDVNQMSSMIHRYMLPTQDSNLLSSTMLSYTPNDQMSLLSFTSPRSGTAAQLSPIPEEFYSRSTSRSNSNRSSPELIKLKPLDQANTHIAIIVDSGSRSESDEDNEADDKPRLTMASQLTLSGASYEEEEDSLFIPSASVPHARAEKQPDFHQWQAESVVVKEELKPFLGQDFVATKARMNLLLKVITGKSGDDTSSDSGTPPSETPHHLNPHVLISDNESFSLSELSESLPVHLASYTDEPLIRKEAVMLEESPIKWPEMPYPEDTEIDVVQMTSTLNHKIKHIYVPLPEPVCNEEVNESDDLFKDWLAHHPVVEAPLNRSAVMLEEMPIRWPEGWEIETRDAETRMSSADDQEDNDEMVDDEISDILSSNKYMVEHIAVRTNDVNVSIGMNTSPTSVRQPNNNQLTRDAAVMTVSADPDSQDASDHMEEGLSITMRSTSTQVTPTVELEELDIVQPIKNQLTCDAAVMAVSADLDSQDSDFIEEGLPMTMRSISTQVTPTAELEELDIVQPNKNQLTCDAAVMAVSADPDSQGSDLIQEGLSMMMRSISTQVTPTAELEELDVMDPILFQTHGSMVLEDSEEEDAYSNQDTMNTFIEESSTKVCRSTSPMKLDHIHPADWSPKPRSPTKKQVFELSSARLGYFVNSSTDDDRTEITELDEDDGVLLEKLKLRKHATELITRRAQDYANQLRERNLNESTSSSDESDIDSSFEDNDYVNEGDIDESDSENCNVGSEEEQPFHPKVTEVVLKELKMTEESGVDLANKLASLEGDQRSGHRSDRPADEPTVTTTLSKLLSPSSSETSDATVIDRRETSHWKPNLISSPRLPQNEPGSNTMPESRVNMLPVISESSPKRQCLPTFSDISSFDSDYAEDEDFQALKASGERIDQLIKEFPSFDDEDYYPDTTEPELLALVDEDDSGDHRTDSLTPTPRLHPVSAPADISVVKYKSHGTPAEGGVVFQETVPFDESANADDLSDLRLDVSPLSPVKAEYLVVDLDEPLKKGSKGNVMNTGLSKQSRLSVSSGIFTASHPMTDSMMSSKDSDDQDLLDIHDAYQDLLQASDSDGRLSQDISPTNACTQTDVDTESIASQAASVMTHDMSIETERDMSWTSPDLESLRDEKEFVCSKIGNTMDRRDVSVELMEAQMMHGMGETDAFLKFIESDLPVEDWFRQRRVAQEQQQTVVMKNIIKKQEVVVKQVSKNIHTSHRRLDVRRSSQEATSTTIHSHSVSPRIFKTSADFDLSSVRPSTQPAASSSGRTTPSQYRKFLQNLRQGIVAATATQEEERSEVQSLLEESQMTRANSRAEIARAKMDLNYHAMHNGYVGEKMNGGAEEKIDGSLTSSRSHSAPVENWNSKATDKNSEMRRLSGETEVGY